VQEVKNLTKYRVSSAAMPNPEREQQRARLHQRIEEAKNLNNKNDRGSSASSNTTSSSSNTTRNKKITKKPPPNFGGGRLGP
jgi:hypothetical protein